LSIAVFACACAFVVQSPGWAQTSYMALTRAIGQGTPHIDRWHWQTHDVAYTDGHFYSVKPPGLSVLTLPLYEGLRAVGAEGAARRARTRGDDGGRYPWGARKLQPQSYGFSAKRARISQAAIANDAPMTWALGLLGVVLPAALLLWLVARVVERVAPGTGTAAALTLGAATMILPFSTLYFSHVLSAVLGFAAFALVWREREGPPRVRLLALAGLLGGLAVVFEYPLAIAALIVGLYALSRPGARGRALLPRAVAYGTGAVAGVLPLLAYNWWAFGSPLHMSYANAVSKTGFTGHQYLGLNDGGVFGITAPRLGDGLMLLFSGRGLLTLSPVLVVAIAGVVLMHREGWRAEARTIGAIALAYLVYNAGYWLPMGGGSPGPRFLIPILPFLAVGLGLAWKRWPAVTLALAAISATSMTVATMTYPMIGDNDTGVWLHRLFDLGVVQHSVLDLAGVAHGVVSILPFAVGVAVALGLGVATLGRTELVRGVGMAPVAIGAWAACALVLPNPGGLPSKEAIWLVAGSAVVALLAIGLALVSGRRAPRSAQEEDHHAAAPLSLEVQPAQRGG
jgi:hypothetical protein